MFALLRVTLNFMMVAVALNLAACSKGGGGGSAPPPVDPYYSYYQDGRPCEPNVQCPGFGPNGERPPPPGSRRPPYEDRRYDDRRDRREVSERRGPRYAEPTHRQEYKSPPPLPETKEEEEPKPFAEDPYIKVQVTGKVVGTIEQQAARTSTGRAAVESRTSWRMSETDGTVTPQGGLILKPGDPLARINNYTGGASPKTGALFTDAKEDEVMTYLRHVVDQMPKDDGFQDNSIELAKRINLIDVRMTESIDDPFEGGVKGRMVYLTVGIKDEKNAAGIETKNLRLNFVGSLNGGTHAVMKLEATTDPTYTFGAVVYCIDKSNTCQNTIVELVQYRNGRPCKVAFAVQRFSDFHLEPNDDSLDRYYMGSKNPQFMAFMQVIANTVEAKELVKMRMQYAMKSPLFTGQGLKTFSVIEGFAMFKLIFKRGVSESYPLEDKFTIAGPLLPSYNKDLAIYSTYELKTIEELWPDPYRTGLAGKLGQVRLLANNGRGYLNIGIKYSGADFPVEKSKFNVVTLGYDTYNLSQFLAKRTEAREILDGGFHPEPEPRQIETPPAPMDGIPVIEKDKVDPSLYNEDGTLNEKGRALDDHLAELSRQRKAEKAVEAAQAKEAYRKLQIQKKKAREAAKANVPPAANAPN